MYLARPLVSTRAASRRRAPATRVHRERGRTISSLTSQFKCLPQTAAAQQILTIKFHPNKAGELRRQLRIKTDLETDAPLTVGIEGVVEP